MTNEYLQMYLVEQSVNLYLDVPSCNPHNVFESATTNTDLTTSISQTMADKLEEGQNVS